MRVAREPIMAKPLLKIHRYFRRKPVRFFSFILLYLTAGSLVFLHSGFSSNTSTTGASGSGRDPLISEGGASTGGGSSTAEGLGLLRRVFKETRRAPRRFRPPWRKENGAQHVPEWAGRGVEHTSSWSHGAKGKTTKEMDNGRGRNSSITISPGFNI
ncbi:WSC domain-containing protein 2-like [Carassius auratus]|uniref:WSC domain-containing protein 2-like n=1 Tax=Carassius auratus TaxID=7957 RepID=A0A6P6N5K6_CARAU|nr:WSC domain-containing protein 2-like [Carassius auratus]